MAIREALLDILNRFASELEEHIDASGQHVWLSNQFKQLLRNIAPLAPFLTIRELTNEDIISYLIEMSYLTKVNFKTPRTETLYIWRQSNEYELMPVLRPKGYYTHLSAMHFHGLLTQEPRSIYFNNEQPARSTVVAELEQSRINNAFQKKQRLTKARTLYGGKEYWLLNGKQTGNHGVIRMKSYGGIEIPVTDLERTLIDITVRPAYAGGVKSVLSAYRLAEPNVSINKLKTMLRALNYVYPYYQSIGFYIETAGNYPMKAVRAFSEFDTFRYDFYLDYEMKGSLYSKKWKLYYPQDLK